MLVVSKRIEWSDQLQVSDTARSARRRAIGQQTQCWIRWPRELAKCINMGVMLIQGHLEKVMRWVSAICFLHKMRPTAENSRLEDRPDSQFQAEFLPLLYSRTKYLFSVSIYNWWSYFYHPSLMQLTQGNHILISL